MSSDAAPTPPTLRGHLPDGVASQAPFGIVATAPFSPFEAAMLKALDAMATSPVAPKTDHDVLDHEHRSSST